jgi:hypothetical protein
MNVYESALRSNGPNVEFVDKWCTYKNLEFVSPCMFQASRLSFIRLQSLKKTTITSIMMAANPAETRLVEKFRTLGKFLTDDETWSYSVIWKQNFNVSNENFHSFPNIKEHSCKNCIWKPCKVSVRICGCVKRKDVISCLLYLLTSVRT